MLSIRFGLVFSWCAFLCFLFCVRARSFAPILKPFDSATLHQTFSIQYYSYVIRSKVRLRAPTIALHQATTTTTAATNTYLTLNA